MMREHGASSWRFDAIDYVSAVKGASELGQRLTGKNQQRGVVQPFIAAMQLFALALMLSRHDISAKVLVDFAVSIPALAAGTALGILTFRHANELTFRRIILVVLFFSGLALAF